MKVNQILETCLYVDDLDAAKDFYTVVLGLKVYSRSENRHLFFRCGNQMLLLFNPGETSKKITEVPVHGANGPGHVAFQIKASEISAWRDHLKQNDVEIESEIDWPKGGYSIYFRDPAGNSLELASVGIWG
ncbi:VOC family protein [candidate division KSB1 bacterium]|nr:VOC family protein [candidate division KSB1 bacterium]